MSMIETYKNITARSNDEQRRSLIEGFEFHVMEDVENDMYKERLSVIPAGSTIIADFAGDFGMYGMTEVDGAIHRIKLMVHDLHKINFGPFEARKL